MEVLSFFFFGFVVWDGVVGSSSFVIIVMIFVKVIFIFIVFVVVVMISVVVKKCVVKYV